MPLIFFHYVVLIVPSNDGHRSANHYYVSRNLIRTLLLSTLKLILSLQSVTQTVSTAVAAVKVANVAEGMLNKRDACTGLNVQWPRTVASSACSCLLTQSPPPATVKGATVTQTITVNVPRTTSTSKVSTISVSSKAPPTTSQSPTTTNNGNCPATKTNAGTCVSPSPVQNPFFANGLTGWTVSAQGGTVNVMSNSNCPDPNEQDPGQDLTHCLAVQFGQTGGVVKLSQTVNPCVGQEYWWGTYQAQFAAQDANASIYIDWLCQSSNTTSASIASSFGAGSSFTSGPPAVGRNSDSNGYLVAMTNPYTIEIVFTSFGATGTPTIFFWDFQPNYAPL